MNRATKRRNLGDGDADDAFRRVCLNGMKCFFIAGQIELWHINRVCCFQHVDIQTAGRRDFFVILSGISIGRFERNQTDVGE